MKHFTLFIFSISIFQLCYSQAFTRSELPTAVTTPWEITYGPDNFLWLTKFGGKVVRVDPSNGNKHVVYTAPDYFNGSPLENSPLCPNQSIGSGTLGLALHPDFLNPATSFIFCLFLQQRNKSSSCH